MSTKQDTESNINNKVLFEKLQELSTSLNKLSIIQKTSADKINKLFKIVNSSMEEKSNEVDIQQHMESMMGSSAGMPNGTENMFEKMQQRKAQMGNTKKPRDL